MASFECVTQPIRRIFPPGCKGIPGVQRDNRPRLCDWIALCRLSLFCASPPCVSPALPN